MGSGNWTCCTYNVEKIEERRMGKKFGEKLKVRGEVTTKRGDTCHPFRGNVEENAKRGPWHKPNVG